MKIAFIVTEFPALSETFILNQITELLDSGHDVEIFARFRPVEKKVHSLVKDYYLMDRVRYFSHVPHKKTTHILKAIYLMIKNFHKSPGKILKSVNIFQYGKDALSLRLLCLLVFCLDKNFDIIHCHFGTNGIIGAYLKEIGIKSKLVTSFHGIDMSTFILNNGSETYNRLFLSGDLFLPISECWERKLIRLGCDKNKITVHRMGINLEQLKYSQKNRQNRESVTTILTVGRLVEKKGHEYAIKALAQVIPKHKNIIYLIAGDGPLRHKLESLVSELEIENHVKFLGSVQQDEAFKLYQQAHIFVLPSITGNNGEQEGIPVVLMEAQAVGLPVISTYHSGIPEVVVAGKSGFLVPEKDVNALGNRIEYLIEHQELWSEMGRYGRKIIEEKYDIKKLNQEMIKVYHNLIENK